MGINTGLSEVDRTHPILDAIGSFRDAVNRLIDEQKAGLLHRGFETEAELAGEAPAPRIAGLELRAAHRGEPSITPRHWTPHPPAHGPGPESPVPSRKLGLNTESAGPAVSEPNPTQHTDDPRQRLDALAKLLDRRRKPAGSSTTDAPLCAVEDKGR